MNLTQPIRAVMVDRTLPDRLVIRDVAPPTPLRHEAIVRVAAFSLNRGEVRRSLTAESGWRPGWDFAGTIEVAAADGSGLPVGTRVVGFLVAGAWAEVVAVATDAIAALPDSIDFATASTLPVAGLTALMTLERGGLLLGKSVLITGASGGVGYLAGQLAAQAGAIVTAQVRRSEQVAFLQAIGVDRVIVGHDFESFAPYDLALDSVGGEILPAVLETLAVDGTCVMFGATAGSDISFNAAKFYSKGGLNLYGFILFHELKTRSAGAGLATLVKQVASGALVPHIEVRAPWTEIAKVAQQLTDRQFMGKGVLQIEA